MAEFSTVMRELYRMCKSFLCEEGCPLYNWHGEYEYDDCYQTVKEQSEEAEKIIMQWAVEHPAETMLQKFKGLFPYAPLRAGIPDVCPAVLGWVASKTNCSHVCCNCWERPYEDNEVE